MTILFRPEALDVDGHVAQNALIIDVFEPASINAVHSGTNNMFKQSKFDDVLCGVVHKTEVMAEDGSTVGVKYYELEEELRDGSSAC